LGISVSFKRLPQRPFMTLPLYGLPFEPRREIQIHTHANRLAVVCSSYSISFSLPPNFFSVFILLLAIIHLQVFPSGFSTRSLILQCIDKSFHTLSPPPRDFFVLGCARNPVERTLSSLGPSDYKHTTVNLIFVKDDFME
jgi:hypothetical protein